eukprot:CAMPEP_0201946100 /NCGR_PEP_ID=MMETSP0903-20130614/54246_1 /ASSEMBLY_ACC=CAM_ASM_000552 /TAXON_ID=420261 /ORGANISM="Thalassiosira antarctica, Strain CCMP982" /LENGTH=279 /DNA_ID=CAMNT_0048489193 /DNA_START=639 /DNA_END=1478 /DNA_ORIENTATION=-
MYPWKLQKIQQPKNGRTGTCRYADLSKPLPKPPKDQTWVQDESSREWKLIPVATVTANDDVAVAVARPPNTNADGTVVAGDDDVCAAAVVAVAVEPATAIHQNKTTTAATGIQYHQVLPTDTFQGICLRYKVTPTELRRANKITMGTNLKLAPAKLVIPTSDKNQLYAPAGPLTKEQKIASLLSKVSRIGCFQNSLALSYSEARAYLELADWDVDCAVGDVNEYFGSKEEQITDLLSKVSRIASKLSYSEARAYLEIADWDVDSAVGDVKEDFGSTGCC